MSTIKVSQKIPCHQEWADIEKSYFNLKNSLKSIMNHAKTTIYISKQQQNNARFSKKSKKELVRRNQAESDQHKIGKRKMY